MQLENQGEHVHGFLLLYYSVSMSPSSSKSFPECQGNAEWGMHVCTWHTIVDSFLYLRQLRSLTPKPGT